MLSAPKTADIFTYGDYATWPFDERWELIEGHAWAMTAPSRLHQQVIVDVLFQIHGYLKNRPCDVYSAPFDVRLPQADEADDQIHTVVQPDVAVICDRRKLDDKGCRGAPDWVIEVLSPATAYRDLEVKRRLYEQHGVTEYWIVHPVEHWLMVYLRNDRGEYGKPEVYDFGQPTPVHLFSDLQIDWSFVLS